MAREHPDLDVSLAGILLRGRHPGTYELEVPQNTQQNSKFLSERTVWNL